MTSSAKVPCQQARLFLSLLAFVPCSLSTGTSLKSSVPACSSVIPLSHCLKLNCCALIPACLLTPLRTDGAGLFCGVLRHLLDRGANCPKVLVATHFHDVFNEDLFDPTDIPVSFRHMQVMFTSSAGAGVEPSADAPSAGARSAAAGAGTGEVDVVSRKVGSAEKITYLYRRVGLPSLHGPG